MSRQRRVWQLFQHKPIVSCRVGHKWGGCRSIWKVKAPTSAGRSRATSQNNCQIGQQNRRGKTRRVNSATKPTTTWRCEEGEADVSVIVFMLFYTNVSKMVPLAQARLGHTIDLFLEIRQFVCWIASPPPSSLALFETYDFPVWQSVGWTVATYEHLRITRANQSKARTAGMSIQCLIGGANGWEAALRQPFLLVYFDIEENSTI